MKVLLAICALLGTICAVLALDSNPPIGPASIWPIGPSSGAQGATPIVSNCIEYQTSGCILYASGPTNVILVQ